MPRMEAGVRRRPSGDFEKRFCVDGRRYSVYAASLRELKEKELQRRQEIADGTYKNNDKITLNDYFKEWTNRRANTVKECTEHIQTQKYQTYISPTIGKRRIKDIERREVLKMQNNLVEKGLAASTVNGIISLLHCILDEAIRDEIIRANPCNKIRTIREKQDKIKASESIHRALTEQEQIAFMDELRNGSDNFYYPLFAFCFSTGVRVGEAAALTWTNIDRKNKIIHITQTATFDRNGKRTTGTPKTKTSIRDIPLKSELLPALEIAHKQDTLINSSKVVSLDTAQLVFMSPFGNMIDTSDLDNKVIPKILKSLENKGVKIARFTMHATRDTFATRFIEQGGTPQTLKTILGHSSLNMTMDLYAHVLPNTKQEEMERMKIYI